MVKKKLSFILFKSVWNARISANTVENESMEVLENRLDFENCYFRTAGDGASGSSFVREACSKLKLSVALSQ